MYINELYDKLPLLSAETYTYIDRDGDCHTESEPVLTEHVLDVYLNDRLTMKLVCIPQYLTELVLGRLLTEGILEDASDVEQIYICEHGRRARVVLCEKEGGNASTSAEPFTELTPSCCTGNHILNDYFLTGKPVKPVTPISWKAEQVFDLADRFHAGMPLHGQTWATHSCFLAKDGQLLFQCEDIGRHNALDKAIGYALRHGIPLSRCMVYSSGRIPTDMAMKAIRAGIPILASKASPTAEAIALAKEYGLTLVCAARRDRMKLFAGTKPEG
ncbi:formate dehydrogenase accessory sulfurtransferase FdhD [Candidatus Merdisoma sp. HCP28S3_D10]|uniref:formate dehydrogenase accessory sulfurtransferase FdhD n=1 Tax=unclassified Candidatus Merdisoma TaxID=3099611 RepID=UPI003F89398D